MGNSQEIDRLLLEVHDGGARIVGSSKGRQQLSVQAAFIRLSRHLERKDGGPGFASFRVEVCRMIKAKLLHDHRLTHARIAVDRHGGHPRRAWMSKHIIPKALL